MESHNQRRKCCVTAGGICWVSAGPGRAIWCRRPAGHRKNLEINTDFCWDLNIRGRPFCVFFLRYLLRLVGIGQRYHHPDDVEIVEGSTGGEGAGQDGRLAAGNLNAALGHGHVQRLHANCGKRKQSAAYVLNTSRICATTCRDLSSLFSCYNSLPNILYFYYLEWLNRSLILNNLLPHTVLGFRLCHDHLIFTSFLEWFEVLDRGGCV